MALLCTVKTGQTQTYSATKNGDPRAAAVDILLADYAFLRLDILINPSSPEPKSQRAGGSGITDVCIVR